MRADSTFLETKNFPGPAIENHQGDWQAYQQHCARCHGNDEAINANYGSKLAYQRQCALAYLGKHAQFNGGVCSYKHPRIFTPKLIVELEKRNNVKRYSRYPWLETLLNLLSEIERIQDQAGTGKVISLVPHRYS